MKAILILCLVSLFALSSAELNDPVLTRGGDLINWIRGGMDGTFIVIFNDDSVNAPAFKKFKAELKDKIQDKYPHFHYRRIEHWIKIYINSYKYFNFL